MLLFRGYKFWRLYMTGNRITDHIMWCLTLMLPPQIRLSILQTKRDNELSLCDKNPSPQICINNDSEIDPIDTIMLKSTIHNQFLNSYCTQFSTVKICHVRNLVSCEFCSLNELKWLQTRRQQQIWWANDIFSE